MVLDKAQKHKTKRLAEKLAGEVDLAEVFRDEPAKKSDKDSNQ